MLSITLKKKIELASSYCCCILVCSNALKWVRPGMAVIQPIQKIQGLIYSTHKEMLQSMNTQLFGLISTLKSSTVRGKSINPKCTLY